MNNNTKLTPGRKLLTGANISVLETSIIDNSNRKILQQSMLWGALNFCLLSILLYDILYSCPLYISYLQYIEYFGAGVLFLNICYHVGICIKIHFYFKRKNVVQPCPQTTPARSNYNLVTNTPSTLLSTPLNTSAASWLNISVNDSMTSSQNYAVKSNSWLYMRPSPKNTGRSPSKTPRHDTSGVDFISDESSLNAYLKDFEASEKLNTLSESNDRSPNILNSFWTHPIAKTTKDVSQFLKRCNYQLSTPTISGSPSFNTNCSSLPNYYYGTQCSECIGTYVSLRKPISDLNVAASSTISPKSDDKNSSLGSPSQGMQTWKRLHVDPIVLTQWNANLRMWISQTILTRLMKEFETVDGTLQKHGFGDVQIGKVGLDRLRKTAQTAPVLQFIQSLPTLIPFLELTPNQEYLVKRIKELAHGGCMSEFKWNSGSSFNGKDWESSLPTDSAIIMHLFASYLDTQLQPLPSKPDVKPFTGYHYIKMNEKPNITSSTLAIQQCSEYPPYYKVIIGEEVFELVKGYNNLFHSILLFLYYVNKTEHGMLGQVNLGRSGVNLLWVIQS